LQIFLLTALTMIAFAANSVLARAALLTTAIDPASYTLIRLASGAAALGVIALMGSNRTERRGGNWSSAAALFGYAAAFSFAYLQLPSGTGALVLFASVQITMIGWGLWRGDRPSAAEWCGLAAAFSAFVWLVSPGITAPDIKSSGLMALAGVCWGVYSVRGKSAADPLQETAGNFLRAAPMALVLSALAHTQFSVPLDGAVLALVSGAVTSGLGYALWYRALKGLTSVQGALVQLSVPAIAAAGGIAFLAEPLTLRFALCSVVILGGIALAVLSKARRAGR
jgi:drug/metabolite transporter (DMT)-like permease